MITNQNQKHEQASLGPVGNRIQSKSAAATLNDWSGRGWAWASLICTSRMAATGSGRTERRAWLGRGDCQVWVAGVDQREPPVRAQRAGAIGRFTQVGRAPRWGLRFAQTPATPSWRTGGLLGSPGWHGGLTSARSLGGGRAGRLISLRRLGSLTPCRAMGSVPAQASSSWTTSPVLAGREKPSGLRRVAGSIPSVWSIVAVKSSRVTGRLATKAACESLDP